MYSRTYQHYVTGLLLLVYICNLTDRAVFSLLMEPIKGEFALSDSELGFLAGPALSLCYAVFGIPIARWADRSNRINIMAAAIVVWSSIVMLTALTAKFWHLALARIGVGIGEAGFSAIAQSVIADYHSVADRTRALSTFMLGIPIAGVVSSLMAGWVNESHGWRAVFIVAGVPGLVLALLMKTTVKEPPRGTHGPTPAQVEQPPLSAVFATLWRRRALRHLAIGMTLLNMLAGGVLGWTAPFFIRTHGMSTGELGTWLAVIAGAGCDG
jgi:MFS family permease